MRVQIENRKRTHFQIVLCLMNNTYIVDEISLNRMEILSRFIRRQHFVCQIFSFEILMRTVVVSVVATFFSLPLLVQPLSVNSSISSFVFGNDRCIVRTYIRVPFSLILLISLTLLLSNNLVPKYIY